MKFDDHWVYPPTKKDKPCPYCGAEKGQYCVTESGKVMLRKYHKAR